MSQGTLKPATFETIDSAWEALVYGLPEGMALCQRLSHFYEVFSVSQTTLADSMGMHRQTLIRWEASQDDPDANQKKKLHSGSRKALIGNAGAELAELAARWLSRGDPPKKKASDATPKNQGTSKTVAGNSSPNSTPGPSSDTIMVHGGAEWREQNRRSSEAIRQKQNESERDQLSVLHRCQDDVSESWEEFSRKHSSNGAGPRIGKAIALEMVHGLWKWLNSRVVVSQMGLIQSTIDETSLPHPRYPTDPVADCPRLLLRINEITSSGAGFSLWLYLRQVTRTDAMSSMLAIEDELEIPDCPYAVITRAKCHDTLRHSLCDEPRLRVTPLEIQAWLSGARP